MEKHDGALFSQLSYRMLDPNTKEENIENINQLLIDEDMSDWYASPFLSDKNIVTYVNDNTKQVHIAHRGTDTSGVTSKSDIKADILLGIGFESESNKFKKRVKKTENIISSVPDEYKIYASGHSLGGKTLGHTMEKSKLARARIESVNLYNAGASPFASQVGKGKKKILDKKVTHYRTENDLVSASLLINNPYGKVVTQETKRSKITKILPGNLKHIFSTLDSLDAHKLYHFRKR